MTLTVTEASAVNRLLRFVAGRPLTSYDHDDSVDADQFSDAVKVLVAKAHKTLMAGAAPRDVSRVVERILGRLTAADSDGAARAVCRALADHVDRGGAIPWPHIELEFARWRKAQP